MRVWILLKLFLNFEDPTPVQNPTTIDATKIKECLNLSNDVSKIQRNLQLMKTKVTSDAVLFFTKFLLRSGFEKTQFYQKPLRPCGSAATTDIYTRYFHRVCTAELVSIPTIKEFF